MSAYDEELQENVENSSVPKGDPMDVKAYQEVFRALKRDPGFELSDSFAEKVMARVISRQRESQARDYFWFGAGIFFLILSAVGTLLFTGFKLDFGFMNVMSDYKGLAIFAIAFITLLNWFDKKIVRRKQLHY